MRIGLLLLFFTLATYVCSAAQDESCAALATGNCAVSRKFLEDQSATRRSPCISAVIKSLGEARDKNAAHVLARYLDYLDPATAPQPGGGADTRPYYPAVTALFLIGEPATRS